MDKTEIVKINATEILDSRGTPTVLCKVMLSGGDFGFASVPSGASTGKFEAHEKRDGGTHFGGRGVQNVCEKIESELFEVLRGKDAANQRLIDGALIRADGMHDRSRYGANALLAVSLACARASANAYGLPLYRYLGGIYGTHMPVPMMNVLNGGAHADNNVDIQEFMLVPVGAKSFRDGVRACAEIYAHLRAVLRKEGYSASVGDEGGFAPDLKSDEEAIELLLKAIKESGYSAEKDISLALDAASSEWYDDGMYIMKKRGGSYTSDELCDYFIGLTNKYPIISLEDPMAENDYRGWERITESLKDRGIRLVGDDLFVTNSNEIRDGKKRKIANSVLIKPNQIGSLTECYDAVSLSRSFGYQTIMSHRSGETEDSFIADLAVALSTDFVKMGAPARGERTAKYNRLMKIESEIFASSYGI
jgi:enolase